jgi:hypothetical protein
MEQFVTHLVHAAAWFFGFVFLFAIIGFIATIRWIASMFRRGEEAVEGAASEVGSRLRR